MIHRQPGGHPALFHDEEKLENWSMCVCSQIIVTIIPRVTGIHRMQVVLFLIQCTLSLNIKVNIQLQEKNNSICDLKKDIFHTGSRAGHWITAFECQ